MPKTYEKLPTLTLAAQSQFSHPPKFPNNIQLTDSAISVMINLEHIVATTVTPTDQITDSLLVEKASTEHVLFVIDEEEKILGAITAEDIHGEKPFQIMQEKQIKRNEIQVNMVMTPYDKILCLDINTLQEAKVSNIVSTLIETKQYFLLVVEKNQHSQTVKGFFWAALIGQGLSNDILDKDASVQSIADIQREFRF